MFEIGQFTNGGYYCGTYTLDNVTYGLFLAPKSLGEYASRIKDRNNQTENIYSLIDGKRNTMFMINDENAVHDAAVKTSTVEINGYTDWYIPSLYEMTLVYRTAKPSEVVNDVKSGVNQNSGLGKYTEFDPLMTSKDELEFEFNDAMGKGYYWTSTEHNGVHNWAVDFDTGKEVNLNKTTVCNVRVVRRAIVEDE
jgi:hypothetical protein